MYTIQGRVIQGQKRGKDLGFPTANVKLSEAIPEGIYISRTAIDKMTYPSVTFIGRAKTFNEDDIKAETFILDFSQDLYGKEIETILLEKIRDNEKFESVEQLIIQMNQDIKKAREYFKTHHV